MQFFELKMPRHFHFEYNWRALKAFLPTFTTFSQILPTFVIFYHFYATFTNSYHFLPQSFNFYDLIPFITLSPFPSFYPLLLTFTHCCFSSIKNVFISFLFFFKSCDMEQSHHLVGCHATGTNSMLIFLLQVLRCLYLGVITKRKN